MDITAITGAIGSLKAIKDVISAINDLQVSNEVLVQINKAHSNVHEVQNALFELREQLFNLQEENQSLKLKLKENEQWEERLSSYEMVETEGAAVVYQSKSDPKHYICPNCIEDNKIKILQDQKSAAGYFKCPEPSCNATYPVKKDIFCEEDSSDEQSTAYDSYIV